VVDTSPRFLTAAEAAKMLKRSTKTLQRLRARGSGPPYHRMNGRGDVLYRESDLLDWLAGRAFRNTTEEALAVAAE
jgi:hypothetical protein